MLSLGISFQGSNTRRWINSTILAFLLLCFIVRASKGASQTSLKSENPPAQALQISYIGNMGVLLSSGGEAIVIDGLHKEYKPTYVFPSDTTTAQLIKGTYQQLGKIKMALITHYHRDHFDAELSLALLSANPESFVLAAAQALDMIREKTQSAVSAIDQQLKQIPYDGTIHQVRNGVIEVRAFKCPHVNARHASVQNLAFLININGHKVLHLGDSNWDVASQALENASLLDESIDIAILPYWMLLNENSKEKVHQLIRPKKLIATHLPPELGPREYTVLHQHHGNIILFDQLNQQIIHK